MTGGKGGTEGTGGKGSTAGKPGTAGLTDPGGGPRALVVLGAGSLLVGAASSLALFGVPRLAGLARGWHALFGWSALPIAVALVGAGAALLVRRDTDPWHLPWGRVLGIELALAAALSLLTSAFGSEPLPTGAVPSEPGPGGLVGWSLASAAAHLLGPVPATLVWFAVGVVGVMTASRIGARQVARGLDHLADILADGRAGPHAPVPGAPGVPSAVARAGDALTPAGRTQTGRGAGMPPGVTPSPVAPGGRRVSDAARRPAPTGAPPASAPSPARRAASEPAPGSRAASGPRARHLPGLDFLGEDRTGEANDAALQAMAATISRTLAGFGVPVEIVEIERGPSVTRFGLRPGVIESGGDRRRVRVARIASLRRDLALALAAPTIRIEAPIPGRALVGIEVPNPELNVVGLKGLLGGQAFQRASRASGLAVALGRDVTGGPVVADLASMPHLLIAGATGTGKSVCLDACLVSLLFQNTPDSLRLVLVDPKRVELVRYNALPHLVAPVVTEVEEVVGALRWTAAEMDERYRRFSARGTRDRTAYNARSPAGDAPMPALVVVIDELADVMMRAAEAAEPLVVRIAQLGRATGIHLIVATQRPSVDVVTGLIKANFPARIAFAVASGTDSRVILDQTGAEALLGRGDMLYQAPDAVSPRRAQGAYASDPEIARLVAFWIDSHWEGPPRVPPWDDLVTPLDPAEALYERARALVGAGGRMNVSLLQRRLRVGFHTARELYGRLVDEGLVDASERGRDDDLDWVDDEFTEG